MDENNQNSAGLYAQVLGARWKELNGTVRRLHGDRVIIHATGSFRVRHGGNALMRLLARLARFPAAAEAVDMKLVVTPSQGTEEWHRSFAGRPMVTTQWQAASGALAEGRGLIEMEFRLDVVDGALHYQRARVRLCLGWLRVPLPGWLAPRVTAYEKSAGEHVHVSVEAGLPLGGRLIAYEGVLTHIEAHPC